MTLSLVVGSWIGRVMAKVGKVGGGPLWDEAEDARLAAYARGETVEG